MGVAIRNCLGVDIGSHSIRVAHMEMGKTGPRVIALLETPLKLEPAMTEIQRHQLIARQLQEMLKTAHIRTKNAVFCVPGLSVFIKRPPKLPKTTPERLDRIIRFEARQQIPFPLDKTIMEYQVFEEGDDKEVNVLMAAIKREYITNFMKMVRRTGLRPLAISVSPLALYNFHELNNSSRSLAQAPPKAKVIVKPKEKKKDKKKGKAKEEETNKVNEAEPQQADANDEVPLEDMGFEEIQAYVNLGSSLMDLAIPKPGQARMIGFTRSVPLAGNEMDRAIRERLGLEDQEKARALKEHEAAIISTEFEMEADTESLNMDACEAVTAVADRIISELRRSLDYYISQPDGVAVDSIVISGGLAQLRYLTSYIEEKMGLPVKVAELKHPDLRKPDQMPEPFCPFAISVGLALQGMRIAQNGINFLPPEFKNAQSLRERPYEIVAIVAMLLLIIGLSFNIGNNYIVRFKKEVEEYSKIIMTAGGTDVQIKAAEARNKGIGQAYEALAKAVGRRDFWFEFLIAFLEKRPPDVLIDEIQMRLDGNVIVKGKSPTRRGITQLVKSFEESAKPPEDAKSLEGAKLLVGNAKRNFTSTQPISDPRFTTGVYDFTLTLKTYVRKTRVRTIGEQPTASRPGNMYNGGSGYPAAPYNGGYR